MNLFILLQVEVRRDESVRRRYRAKGLTESKGPGALVFYNEQAGRDMSVLEYFDLTYHIKCVLATAEVHEPCPPHARLNAAYGLMPPSHIACCQPPVMKQLLSRDRLCCTAPGRALCPSLACS